MKAHTLSKLLLLTLPFVFTAIPSEGEIINQVKIHEQRGNCFLVERYWTGGFSERHTIRWECAEAAQNRVAQERLSDQQVQNYLESMRGQIREYLNNPANRSALVLERYAQVNSFKDTRANPYQRRCADAYSSLYSSGVIDYKLDFQQAYCEAINNRYSFECMDLVQNYEFSAIRDQYDHSRRSLLQACGSINTALKLDYLRAAMAAITDHNHRKELKQELNDLWLKSARFVESPFNLQCFNFVTRKNEFAGIFAEACDGIRTESSFRRLVRIAREKRVLYDQDIRLAADEPWSQRRN